MTVAWARTHTNGVLLANPPHSCVIPMCVYFLSAFTITTTAAADPPQSPANTHKHTHSITRKRTGRIIWSCALSSSNEALWWFDWHPARYLSFCFGPGGGRGAGRRKWGCGEGDGKSGNEGAKREDGLGSGRMGMDNGKKLMKTGWNDGVGVEKKRVMGVVGGREKVIERGLKKEGKIKWSFELEDNGSHEK